MKPHHLLHFTAALMLGWVAGCSSLDMGSWMAEKPKPTTKPSASDPSVEALTRKTTAYAQEMDARLVKRTAPSTAPAAIANSDTSALAVPTPQWAKPEPLHFTPVPVTYSHAAEVTVPAAPVVPVVEKPKQTAPVILSSDPLDNRLAQQIQKHPRDLVGQLDYQLLQLLQEQQVPQLSSIAALPAEDRDLLIALLDGLSNFRSALRTDSNMLTTKKIQPLVEMADRLRSQAELSIPTVSLCTRVDRYGVYQPVDPPRFTAGRAIPIILYTEVANFSSVLNETRQWQTKLTQEVVLYTESGMPVWPANSKPVQIMDVCRNRRHDFFYARQIDLPAGLSLGQYLLKVTVTDQQASRVAEATLPIQIVAQ